MVNAWLLSQSNLVLSHFSPNLIRGLAQSRFVFVSVKCRREKSKLNMNLIWDQAPVQMGVYRNSRNFRIIFVHLVFVVIYYLQVQGAVDSHCSCDSFILNFRFFIFAVLTTANISRITVYPCFCHPFFFY